MFRVAITNKEEYTKLINALAAANYLTAKGRLLSSVDYFSKYAGITDTTFGNISETITQFKI